MRVSALAGGGCVNGIAYILVYVRCVRVFSRTSPSNIGTQ